jgi:hypothetical protein
MLEIQDVQVLNTQKMQVHADKINSMIATAKTTLGLQPHQNLADAATQANFCTTIWPIAKEIIDFLAELATIFAFSKNWGPYITEAEMFITQFCTPIPPITAP